jgi:hypothetical protein
LLNTKNIEDEIEYKRLKALTKREVRKRHRQSWETFITQLETDLNRVRTNDFKILNHMWKDVKESVKITCCSKQKFLKYCKELWTETSHEETERGTDNEDEQEIILEELELALKKIKCGKSPGEDQINSGTLQICRQQFP